MMEEAVDHVPVLVGGRVVGMCTRTDLLRARHPRPPPTTVSRGGCPDADGRHRRGDRHVWPVPAVAEDGAAAVAHLRQQAGRLAALVGGRRHGPAVPAPGRHGASRRGGRRRRRSGPRRPASRRWRSWPGRGRPRCASPRPRRGPTARAPTAGRCAGTAAAGRRARRPARPPSASAPPDGLTRLTSPIRSASVPSTPRPVRIRSIARLWPISRGRRTVPRSTSGTPNRRQ